MKHLALQTARFLLAGYASTLVMEQFSSWWYQRQDETSRRREEELREAMPTTVLAEKVDRLLGLQLKPDAIESLGMWLHYAIGATGGLAALALRARGWKGIRAGLATGVAMSVAVDEGLNYLLGLAAPPGSWPWQAHARGFAAHLVYGATLGILIDDATPNNGPM